MKFWPYFYVALFITSGCQQISPPEEQSGIVLDECPEEPQVRLFEKNLQEIDLNDEFTESAVARRNKTLGYIFQGKKDEKLTYQTKEDICIWVYTPDGEILNSSILPKTGKYIIQVGTIQASLPFDLAINLEEKQTNNDTLRFSSESNLIEENIQEKISEKSSSNGSKASNTERIVDNYKVSKCGSIFDSNTGLEWYIGPDLNVTWDEAQTWTTNLRACGGRWRMPTINELRTIYNRAFTAGKGYYTRGAYWPAHIHPVFEAIGGGSWVWTNETVGSINARSFNFNQGQAVEYSRNNTTYSTRMFAVR